jgi:hypothetical protein
MTALTTTTTAASEPTPRRCCVAHAWVSDETYAALERAANARRMHPDMLAAELLLAVLLRDHDDAGLIDALLSGLWRR